VTRAVFDCVILLQAAGRPSGPAAACLQAVRDGRLELVISPDILAEVRDVLTRPKTLRKFPALTPEAVDAFLADLASHATTLASVPKVFSLPRDPKDEPYIDLAVAAQARYLVSRDNDLLDLMNDAAFRQQFPDLTVIDPVALLRELAPTPEPEPDQGPTEGEGQGGGSKGG
jgi:putative PIN family toxin of toxin-antitoxin system